MSGEGDEIHPDSFVSKKSRKRAPGRPVGSGSFEATDEPLLEEMRAAILERTAHSPSAAAYQVAERADGAGTLESKVKRLARRYSEKFSETKR